ncbi:MAG: flagellar motor stator protein MotA [Bryobacterales bacterium]|nr:flagellar motor stator protein MotA [Bryobacterales bacterium]
MLSIVGILVVIGAVIGGYLLEHGNLLVLLQPAELVIIGGAAFGTMLIANPLPTVMAIVKGILAVFKGSRCTKAFYLETLKMLNELFSYARKNSLAKLEPDVEEPTKSQLFGKYPKLVSDHHALHFVCDTMRMLITGGINNHDLDQMMEMDVEVHHHEKMLPVKALSSVADALPGLGIVAAVLGVVITMGALGGPPEEIGHKVAAALVGTFLGILMCYGFFGPLASHMGRLNDDEAQYYQCLRVGLISFAKGAPPLVATEFARRSVPSHVRPTFKEMETAVKGGGAAAAA